MQRHLAIFSKDHIEDLFNGKKEVEVRVSQKRISPFGVVNVGDQVYIKPSGGDVIGQFFVKKIISFEAPDEKDWRLVKQLSPNNLKITKLKTENYKYVTIIYMDQIERFITSPIKIKKGDSRAWVVINKND